MRLLDKYINSSIYKIFFSTVFVFSCLYLVIDLTSDIDKIIEREIPWSIVIKYYLAFIPIILVQTSSFCCLLAVLFTFSSLHNNNEIIAMRSSGLNFWQVTKPAIIFGLLVSVGVFWLSEMYVPKATEETRKIKNENMSKEEDKKNRIQKEIKNLTFYGLKNRLYFIDNYNPNENILNGITIIEYDNNLNIQQKILALKGVWTGINWKFYQCQISTFTPGRITDNVKVKVYNEKLMDIQETPEDFLRQQIKVSMMNTLELKEYIDRFAGSGATKALNSLRVDYHQKIAFPFGNFVIVLVGLPFAMMVKTRKGMTFTSIGIAIIIGFLFYVANAVCIAFGKAEFLPPILAAWTAPLIFTGIAIAVIESNFSSN